MNNIINRFDTIYTIIAFLMGTVTTMILLPLSPTLTIIDPTIYMFGAVVFATLLAIYVLLTMAYYEIGFANMNFYINGILVPLWNVLFQVGALFATGVAINAMIAIGLILFLLVNLIMLVISLVLPRG